MNAGAMQRLLAPRSIALVGGAWADAALAASTVVGYTGEVWRVHPSRASSTAQRYFRSIDELPPCGARWTSGQPIMCELDEA